MVEAKGLDKENSDEIGFVVTALFCSALSLDELHKWCFELISSNHIDDVPPYIFDLADFNGPLADVFAIIGFAPVWKHTEDDRAALYGIAAKRTTERYDWPVPPETALEKLGQHPEIERRFRTTFPFIEYQ